MVEYSEAKEKCPLINHTTQPEPVWVISPIPTPEGCEGQWYSFVSQNDPTNYGRAREDMLPLYVGEKTAQAAIEALK